MDILLLQCVKCFLDLYNLAWKSKEIEKDKIGITGISKSLSFHKKLEGSFVCVSKGLLSQCVVWTTGQRQKYAELRSNLRIFREQSSEGVLFQLMEVAWTALKNSLPSVSKARNQKWKSVG